jgi:transcription antitermination factor NusG
MAVACPVRPASTESEANRPWFAVQVRATREKLVNLQLENKNLECFLPLYTTKKPGCDRIRIKQLPLFPGYLFCRLDPVNRLPVLITPGVMQIVGVAREPVPIDDAEIAAIHGVLRSGRAASPFPYQSPQAKQRVRIEHGPLAGLEGEIVRVKSRDRLVVSVTLLQRSVAVEIDDEVSIVGTN